MLKVGVLGAPGAGKSSFAKKLARSQAKNEKFIVVDGYVENLEQKTGYFFREFSATHPQNYQILFYRWTQEQEIAHKTKCGSITCGTLYETALYTAVHSLLIEQNEPFNPEEAIQIEAAMRGLAMIETLISDYDVLFYLPYDEAKVTEKKGTHDLVVDQKIPQILEGYYKHAVRLEGSEKVKVKNASKYVNEIRAQTTEDDELSVRGSGEPDSEEPVPSELLSNMFGGGSRNSSGDDGLAG